MLRYLNDSLAEIGMDPNFSARKTSLLEAGGRTQTAKVSGKTTPSASADPSPGWRLAFLWGAVFARGHNGPPFPLPAKAR